MASPQTTVTPINPRHPRDYETNPPTHHISSPPTSFRNPWPSYIPSSLTSLFKTRWTTPKNFVPVPADRAGLPRVIEPSFSPASPGLKATWIGHASFLVETPCSHNHERGVRILLDPVWSNRVGPYGVVGPVRFSPPPCPLSALPHIDAVLISHDHYDHLDSWTLKTLNAQQDGNLRVFCALGVKAVILGLGVGFTNDQVREMDWWDAVTLDVDIAEHTQDGQRPSVELVCTPAQHRSGRTPWGFESTLWCSWVISEGVPHPTASAKPEPKKLFFAGDTGYCHVASDAEASHHNAPHPPCPAFKQIGDMYGPFDLALLPIGCFKPRSVLSGQHSSPEDSLAIHKDVQSKKSIGMHYGTLRGAFSAQYEPVTEPAERWRKGAEAEGLEWGKEVALCDIGETVVV